MSFPVAVQLYSVRDNMAEDFEGTIKKVKEMGYDGVEFAGLFDKSPAEVKRICEDNGLVPVSAHVSYDVIAADPEKVIGDYAKISEMEDVKLIGHITKESLGRILVTRDDNEFELKAQGWNPLKGE